MAQKSKGEKEKDKKKSTETQLLDVESYLNKPTEQKVAYNKRDLLLYALGIGCTDLKFIYEHDEHFTPFPTYPIVLGYKGDDIDVVSFPSPTMMEGPALPPLPDITVGLDGERYIEKLSDLDPSGGELSMTSKLLGIHKRRSGALVESETIMKNKDGTPIYKLISGAFLVGANKGFKECGTSHSETVVVPERAADHIVEVVTSSSMPALYRLSGDYNPLHIDPVEAKQLGFKQPIMHGLCSMGITCNQVLKRYCPDEPSRFKALRVRFASPVIPGQTLVIRMWTESENKVIIVTTVKETNKIAINNAYLLLNPVASPDAEDTPGQVSKL